ncbi:MarR family winged helix-turn-helix transcriptional regulator [Streptomyces sp. NPDC058459]|uniref:MarR family winged helix-turn-helix transcriptional regulator n=1 Tax=Streptomyces sp. NPDC058459 TaxID=3346508 RepID=UPI00365C1F5A
MSDAEEHHADLPPCPSLQGGGLLPQELRAWMLLLAVTGGVEQHMRTAVKERLDVSHDEFLILCVLADQSDASLRMTRIAELLGRPKTRLTYQIACLQHAGLVARKPVSGDRRGIQVTLTERGHNALDEASRPLAETVVATLGRYVGPAQREAIERLLPALAQEPGSGADAD